MNSSTSLDFSELEECLKNLNDLQKSIQEGISKKSDKKSVLKSNGSETTEPNSKNCQNLDDLISTLKLQENKEQTQDQQQTLHSSPPLQQIRNSVKLRKKNANRDIVYRTTATSTNNHYIKRNHHSIGTTVRNLKLSTIEDADDAEYDETNQSNGGITRWRSVSHNMSHGMMNGGSGCFSLTSLSNHTGSLPRVFIGDDDHRASVIYKSSSQTNLSRPNSEYKTPITIHQPDKTTKTILIDELTTAGEICQVLTARNYMAPDIGLSLVEKIPHLKIERCFEDDELPLSCILSYKDLEKPSLIFFEQRKDKYGLFTEPEQWLGSSYKDSTHQMLKEIFSGPFPQLPTFRSYLFYKMPQKKTWRRRLCVLRNSGLYVYRQSKINDSTNMQLVISLYPSLYLYTTIGGWSSIKSPTPYGFCLKTYGEQNPKFIAYFCALSESNLRYWSSLFRIAMRGKSLLQNYENHKKFVQETLQTLNSQDTTSKLLSHLSKSIGCVTGRSDLQTDL